MGHRAKGRDTGEKGGEAEPRTSVCRGSGRAQGSWEAIPNGICVLYDRLASVESKEPGVEAEKTDEDLEALMKWMGKGANYDPAGQEVTAGGCGHLASPGRARGCGGLQQEGS